MRDNDEHAAATLIVGPAWVGDMVMAQALFKLLRRQAPATAIDVVAPAWSEPLLVRMPEVRSTVMLPLGHGQVGFAARYAIGRGLRGRHYDHAIIMPRSLKSALVPCFAGIPRRTGFRGEMRYGLLNDVRELDKARLDQTVKRFIALGLPAGAELPRPPDPELQIDIPNRDRLCEHLGADDAPLVALMPGAAYGPAKCWPIEYFGELARSLTGAGARVVVLGSQADHPVGERICGRAGAGALNWCGSTRLEDTVDILSIARVAVTNDSGLMHVAAATGTHVAAIYGSSTAAFTPPLTAAKTIFDRELACRPCFQRACPLGHLDCLRGITPERVRDGVRAVLDAEQAQSSR